VRSFNPSTSATSYFSIDGGTTDIVNFNQLSSGDTGDWLSNSCPATPRVQDAFRCLGQVAAFNVNSPEITALDVVGYDVNLSEPATLTLLAGGVLGLAAARRRYSASKSA
jgi:hypothetical protein